MVLKDLHYGISSWALLHDSGIVMNLWASGALSMLPGTQVDTVVLFYSKKCYFKAYDRKQKSTPDTSAFFQLQETPDALCLPSSSSQKPLISIAQAVPQLLAVHSEGRLVDTMKELLNLSQLPYGKALYSYEGKEPGDLKFNKGDIIILRRKVDENWYHGELQGTHGFLPASYIQCIRPLPQALPQGKALYDFEMKDRDQDKDCLTFTKLNDSAKQLIEMDKLYPTAATACNYDALLSSDPSTVASVASGPTLSTSGAVSAFQRRVDSKKNAKKRHSFTALSVTHKSSQAASHRHSMEISAPVLISSSDPRAAARIGELAHLSCTVPAQDSSSAGPIPTAIPRGATVAGEQGMSPKVQLPLNVYLALYAYKPQKNDELELRKGEMYRVLEKCQDGWFKGASLKTGVSGVFPGNYVTPVSSQGFMEDAQRPEKDCPEVLEKEGYVDKEASAITPPNVSAANLSGEVGGTSISGLPIPSPINTGYKPDDKKNE
ncbi:hypothetical protein A6R68_17380, partial [Neotoma lepida]